MYPYHKNTNIHILLLLVTYIDIVCIPNNTMVVLLYFDINESVKCKLWTLDILFSSYRNIHKSSSGRSFWASDSLIDGF